MNVNVNTKKMLIALKEILIIVLAISLAAALIWSVFSIHRESRAIFVAVSVFIAISLVYISMFLRNSRIVQLLLLLSICVITVAYTG